VALLAHLPQAHLASAPFPDSLAFCRRGSPWLLFGPLVHFLRHKSPEVRCVLLRGFTLCEGTFLGARCSMMFSMSTDVSDGATSIELVCGPHVVPSAVIHWRCTAAHRHQTPTVEM